MKNNKGITLISLIITIVVLLILTGIAINYGTETIKNAKLETLKTNMMLIKAKTMEYVEEANFKAGTSGQLKDGDNIKTEVANELKGELIPQSSNTYSFINYSESEGQYLYNVNGILSDIGLKDVEIDSSKDEKYLVVYDISNAKVEVYNTIGFKIEGNLIHDLTTLQEQ
ncbi:MAG: prepilin-type N-terminal cleavage/methylation domain-containing protein [Clostridia bacterium]|nr:prepilin-type N-terminal cleavage/methylation domain-containing protein [Clostridia bacterium]